MPCYKKALTAISKTVQFVQFAKYKTQVLSYWKRACENNAKRVKHRHLTESHLCRFCARRLSLYGRRDFVRLWEKAASKFKPGA